MKHGHLTEQRKHFVEAYCRLGNGTLAAKEAGYKDSPSLANQASKLKRELSAKISERLTVNQAQSARKYFRGDSNEFTELRHRKRFLGIIKRFLHNRTFSYPLICINR